LVHGLLLVFKRDGWPELWTIIAVNPGSYPTVERRGLTGNAYISPFLRLSGDEPD
jgi:hypothetical protein